MLWRDLKTEKRSRGAISAFGTERPFSVRHRASATKGRTDVRPGPINACS
jgi:hypothetical protein